MNDVTFFSIQFSEDFSVKTTPINGGTLNKKKIDVKINSFSLERRGYFLKKLWCCVGGEVVNKNLVS